MPTSSLKLRLLSLGQTLVRRQSLPSAFVTPVFRRCLNLICSDTRGMSTYATPIRAEDEITVHFLKKDGKRISVNSLTGVTLLEIVKRNLDFEGFGACEGTLACSTCHLILEEVVYKKLDPITNEEMDLLDLTYGLTDTSRLGCQVCLSKALDGMTVHVPEVVSDCLDIKTKNKDTAL